MSQIKSSANPRLRQRIHCSRVPHCEAHQFNDQRKKGPHLNIITDNPPVDECHYPDSKKWGALRPRRYFRPAEVDYFDGEE